LHSHKKKGGFADIVASIYCNLQDDVQDSLVLVTEYPTLYPPHCTWHLNIQHLSSVEVFRARLLIAINSEHYRAISTKA
jgi:hypothetical protein